jgi:hypothetical protein
MGITLSLFPRLTVMNMEMICPAALLTAVLIPCQREAAIPLHLPRASGRTLWTKARILRPN